MRPGSRLIQTGRSWVPKSRYENYAPFLQVDYIGIDRLTVTGGVRYEDGEARRWMTSPPSASSGSRFVRGGEPDFSETLYNIGATYRLTDAWRVFANCAEAFSMPGRGARAPRHQHSQSERRELPRSEAGAHPRTPRSASSSRTRFWMRRSRTSDPTPTWGSACNVAATVSTPSQREKTDDRR